MVSALKNIAKSETVEKSEIGKRYQIVRPLSGGGMSRTYLAKDKQRPNHPICVVKQLKSSMSTEEEPKNIQRLFEKEAETLEKLGNHDQIPRLLAYFEEDGSFYLVQEFIEGHSLTHEMPLGEWWTEAQVIKLLKELLEILSFIHSQNVIHLDIKPANIIRRQHDNKLVLIDFGAVKRVNLLPATHTELGETQSTVLTCIGTKGYMPIEQMMGKPNLSSDLYALGMTAIQALTGILPLQLRDDDNGEVAWRDQSEVSDALADVLTKMVRRYHKQRHQSIAEVLAAFESVEMGAIIQSALPLKIDSSQSLNQEVVAHSLRTTQSKSNPAASNAVASTPIDSGAVESNLASFFTFSQFSQNHSGAGSIPTINHGPIGFTETDNDPSTESDSESLKDTPAKKHFFNAPFLQQKGLLRKVSIGVCAASFVMGSGYAAYRQWQRSNDKTALAELKVLVQQEKTEGCIAQAITFPNRSPDLHQQAIEYLETCSQQVVEDAGNLHQQSSLLAAVELLKTVSDKAPIAYKKAQKFAVEWHTEIVTRAENHYKVHQANDAIAMLKALPEDSPVYEEAQEKVASWQAEWTANKSLISEAQALAGNDGNLTEAESYAHENKIDSARGALSDAEGVTATAQAKLGALQVLGEPISLDDSGTNNLEGFKDVADSITWRTSQADTLRNLINRKEKYPLEKSGELTEGTSGVRLLEEGIENENVLAKDYTIWGDEGDVWTISMESDDFDTVVHLIYPNGSGTSTRPHVVSNDDGGRNFNSRLQNIRLPRSGYYKIRASAYYSPSNASSAGTGSYQLIVTNE